MSESAENAVLIERRGQVGWITLNRPAAHNAIDDSIRLQLPKRLLEANEDSELRVLVLTGAGDRAFCVGADIKQFGNVESPVEYRRSRTAAHWISAFDQVTKPIIAAIKGYCLGGGLEIALACDIRFASEGAQFALPEVGHATIPGAGGTQRLSRVVGLGPALDLILTGERISAERAFEIGLVTRIASVESFSEDVMALAERIAGLSPLAMRHAKEATVKGFDLSLQSGMTLELDLLALLLPTDDRSEASAAFREKRKPSFKGK